MAFEVTIASIAGFQDKSMCIVQNLPLVPRRPVSKTGNLGSQRKMQLKRKHDFFFRDQITSSPQSSQLRTFCMTKMSLPKKSMSISGQAYMLSAVVIVVLAVVVVVVVVVGSSVGSGEGSGQ